DDDIFLAVDQVDEALFILLGHIAGIQPAIFQYFGRGLGVIVVTSHDAGAFYAQLADFALLDFIALLIHDLDFPAVSWHPDSADLADVFHPEVHTARSDRFAEPVVGIIFMVREELLPGLDQAFWHWLRADVHEPPLRKLIVAQIHLTAIDGIEDVLSPWHEQPDDGATLFRDGF